MTEADAGRADGFARIPGGGEIAYQVRGPDAVGPPILLIRPLGGSMALWGAFRSALTRTHRVVAFDHRGSGYSSPTPSRTTTASLARDGLHVLDHLGISQARVFGISLGGMVATWLAILAPSRVAKLCVAAAPAQGLALSHAGLARALSLAACLARPVDRIEACLVDRILSPRFRETHGEEVRRIERLASAEPTSRAELVKLAIAAALHDARSELHRITAPTLTLAGDHDELLGTEPPRALAAAIRGAKFAVIRDAGHDLTLEQPAATAACVTAFFDEPTSPGW